MNEQATATTVAGLVEGGQLFRGEAEAFLQNPKLHAVHPYSSRLEVGTVTYVRNSSCSTQHSAYENEKGRENAVPVCLLSLLQHTTQRIRYAPCLHCTLQAPARAPGLLAGT